VGLADALAFVESHSHPRLWRLIGEAAIKQMDLAVGHRSFVKCVDFYGIQFVKKIKLIKVNSLYEINLMLLEI